MLDINIFIYLSDGILIVNLYMLKINYMLI